MISCPGCSAQFDSYFTGANGLKATTFVRLISGNTYEAYILDGEIIVHRCADPNEAKTRKIWIQVC